MAKSEVGKFFYVGCSKAMYKFKVLKPRHQTIYSKKLAINICIREWSENNGSGTYERLLLKGGKTCSES